MWHGNDSKAYALESKNLIEGNNVAVTIGLIIGVVLGLTGAGGSVFAVPLLLLFTAMSASDAMGIALGAVAVSAIYGTLVYGRKTVLWTPALLLAGGGMLTAPLGKWLSQQVNENLLVVGFSLLAIIIAVRMWQQVKQHAQDTAVVRGNLGTGDMPDGLLCRMSPTGQFQLKPRCVSGLMAGGLLIGFMSGLFGVGGGFLIVPLLIYLSQLDMRIAVATSLFVIAVISTSGFLSHLLMAPHMDWSNLSLIMLASIIGMMLSQLFSKKLAGPNLQKIFSISLLLVAFITLLEKLL